MKKFLEFFLYWFYMFSLYYSIFQKFMWEVISVYFLWFHYEILRQWKAAKKDHSVWPTSIGILWKWSSKRTMLAGDGECRLTRFHLIRNFLANEIYHFSRFSHQTGCLFTEDSPLHIISFLFSYFCLFQNAVLHKIFKLVFWNFRSIFLRMEFS